MNKTIIKNRRQIYLSYLSSLIIYLFNKFINTNFIYTNYNQFSMLRK